MEPYFQTGRGKYNIIYADPPWRYDFSKSKSRSIEVKYQTMDIKDIRNIPIINIAHNDCALFIWGTWPKLKEIISVIDAWGFNYKTVAFVWIKTIKSLNPNQYSFLPQHSFADFTGMGMYTRSNSEYCLLAIKGRIKRKNTNVKQIIYAPLREHSKKPKETRKRIVQLFGDLPRIELFAREKTEGWHVWGNEIESDIQLNSFNEGDPSWLSTSKV